MRPLSKPRFKVGDHVSARIDNDMVPGTIWSAPKTSRGQYTVEFDERHPELGLFERVGEKHIELLLQQQQLTGAIQ